MEHWGTPERESNKKVGVPAVALVSIHIWLWASHFLFLSFHGLPTSNDRVGVHGVSTFSETEPLVLINTYEDPRI